MCRSALLLVGGITALPWLIALLLRPARPAGWRTALLPLLAVERARRVRESAAVAVSGVVASLSLAVALTVMVASFRDSVTHWLDVVLPADLYVRTAAAALRPATRPISRPNLCRRVAQPARRAARAATLRTAPLLLDAGTARRHADRPRASTTRRSALPLVGEPLPVPPGQIGIYVSEAMVDLYGARPGTVFAPLSQAFRPLTPATDAHAPIAATFFVAGVWRDYARQFGAIAMDQRDFERLTGDRARQRPGAVAQRPGADAGSVQQATARRWPTSRPGGGRAAGIRLRQPDPRHVAADF